MFKFLIPLIVFVTIAVFLTAGLYRDPRLVPSPLVGNSAPEFSLSSLHDPNMQLTVGHLKGQVSLLNVWATWCAACYAEHPMLMELAQKSGIPLVGVNYKDERDKALEWLEKYGDPYQINIFDPDGTLSLDLGVYGAPETFVLDADGMIAYKHVGPITAQVWEETLAPLLKTLVGNK